MFAPLTALFTRSVMLRTRHPVVAWSRSGLGALLFLYLLLSESGVSRSSAPGRELLISIAIMTASMLALAVMISSSAAITEEKEQRTLGLLRMTGLDPFAILLAKSTARLCEALLLMASTLPLALLATTLGGVTVVQVLAVYAALATWVALVANLGLFWSVLCRTGNAAAGAALATMLVLPVTLMLVLWFTGGSYGPLAWIGDLWGFTVFARLWVVLSTGYSGAVMAWSDAVHVGLALALFIAAWLCFRTQRNALGDDGPAESGPRPSLAAGGARGLANPWSLFVAGRPRAGTAALRWKEFHFSSGGRLGVAVWIALPIAMTVIIRLIESSGSADRHTWGLELGSITLIALVVRLGGGFSHLISAENRAGTLDDLIALPLSPLALFAAKLRGVLFAALPLGIMCAGSWILVLIETINNSYGNWSDREIADTGWVLLGGALEIVDFWLWCLLLSVVLARGAFAVACFAVGAANTAIYVLLGMMVAALAVGGGGPMVAEAFFYLWYLCMAGLGVALACITVVRVRALGPS